MHNAAERLRAEHAQATQSAVESLFRPGGTTWERVREVEAMLADFINGPRHRAGEQIRSKFGDTETVYVVTGAEYRLGAIGRRLVGRWVLSVRAPGCAGHHRDEDALPA
jgi:hypothetical protein